MSKVAFCFIVKDGRKYLKKNLNKIINLGNTYFDEYRIYYAENDSTDGTIEILQTFKNKYDNIHGTHLKIDGLHSTKLCENDTNFNCSKRTRRLAYLRNIVLNEAKKWNDCNYLIMLDLDFVDFDQKQFIKMFNIINNNPNFDGIFGMSVNQDNYPYDVGAITPSNKIYFILCEIKLVKVSSAFSGFGIYKMKSIKNIQYNIKTNDIEHIDFNKQLNNLYVYTLFKPKYQGSSHLFKIVSLFNIKYNDFTHIIKIFSLLLILFIIVKKII
jgi:hypothetical protein